MIWYIGCGAGVVEEVVVGNGQGWTGALQNQKKQRDGLGACPTCTTLLVEVLIDEMMNRLALSPSHPAP